MSAARPPLPALAATRVPFLLQSADPYRGTWSIFLNANSKSSLTCHGSATVKRLCLVCLLGLWLLPGCADPTPTPCDPAEDTQRCSGSEIRQECSAESANWVNVELCPTDTSCGGNGRACQQVLSEGECRSKSDCVEPHPNYPESTLDCYHPLEQDHYESCGNQVCAIEFAKEWGSLASCGLDTDCSDAGGFCVVGRCASEPGACTWFF